MTHLQDLGHLELGWSQLGAPPAIYALLPLTDGKHIGDGALARTTGSGANGRAGCIVQTSGAVTYAPVTEDVTVGAI